MPSPFTQGSRCFTSENRVGTTLAIVPKSLGKFSLLALLLVGAPAFAQDASRALADLPGFDFSRLSAPAKKELASVLTDEFDYCGRPLTLLASLKKGDACKHTKRLVGLAAAMANDGAPAGEILVALSRYNQTFITKRAKLIVDERLCMGPKDAKVTMTEFSDFECPGCGAVRPIIEGIVKSKANTRLCWAPYPLPMHTHAVIAGQAALFARDNGKFWPMHDALFENQAILSDETIKDLMKKLGLDVAAFSKAVAANKYLEELNASKEVGHTAQVDSTPTVFVNGRKMSLIPTAENLGLAIDDELEWVTGNNAWPSN